MNLLHTLRQQSPRLHPSPSLAQPTLGDLLHELGRSGGGLEDWPRTSFPKWRQAYGIFSPGKNVVDSGESWIYPLVMTVTVWYWKWLFIQSFAGKMVIFHCYVILPEGKLHGAGTFTHKTGWFCAGKRWDSCFSTMEQMGLIWSKRCTSLVNMIDLITMIYYS